MCDAISFICIFTPGAHPLITLVPLAAMDWRSRRGIAIDRMARGTREKSHDANYWILLQYSERAKDSR